MSKSQRSREQLEEIAAQLWTHENVKWKREIWIKEQLIPELSPEDLNEIHELLKDLTSLTSDMGIDSSDEDKKIYKQMTSKIMKKIKEISPEYYECIK